MIASGSREVPASRRRRWPRHCIVASAAIILPLALSACGSGVLDPKGPVGAAELTILIDSLAIMLAIVVPTIAATLAFAWWFRAGNKRARYRPDWEFSGQIEVLVWSIAAHDHHAAGRRRLDRLAHARPGARAAVGRPPLEVQVVSLDWKWLFIYPDRQVAAVNELVVPAGVPVRFTLTSASVMNAFFIPRLGSMIYTMNGMASELNLQADAPGTYQGRSTHYQRRRLLGHGLSRCGRVPADEFAGWLDQTAARRRADARRDELCAARRAEQRRRHRSPSARWIPGCSIGSSRRTCRPDPARRSRPILAPPGERGTRMLGKLSWAAIPLDQPIPLVAAAVVGVVILGRARAGRR